MSRDKEAKKPRKIAKQSRSQETVSSILEASTRILSRDGLKNFSTNQIARLAGVGIGSLYEYFPNKFSIIRQLVQKRIDKKMEFIRARLDEGANLPLAESVSHFVDGVMAFYDNPKRDAILLDNLYAVGMDGYMKEAKEKVVGWMVEILRNYGVREEDLEYVAFISVQSLHAIAHSAASTNPELLLDPKFKKETAALFISYFQSKKS